MSITAYQTTRLGNVTTVRVTSGLSGTIYYHWYLDGFWVASTTAPRRDFLLPLGDQVRVDVLDTLDADFDPIANAPAGWPSRRLLWWLRSLDGGIEHYRLEQKKGAGDWSAVAVVRHQNESWSYELLSDRLDDLSQYTWRIVPVDAAGNDGTPFTIGPEEIVRTPDAPDFAIAFDNQTTKVTFSETA